MLHARLQEVPLGVSSVLGLVSWDFKFAFIVNFVVCGHSVTKRGGRQGDSSRYEQEERSGTHTQTHTQRAL